MVVCGSKSLTVRHMMKVTTQEQPALGQSLFLYFQFHARADLYASVSYKIES